MRIEFHPHEDSPADVAAFIQGCFDKGQRVQVVVLPPLKGLPAPSQSLTTKGTPRKKAPTITREIYNRIKAGDSITQSAYSRAAISSVLNTNSWETFAAKKAAKSKKMLKARQSKSR